MKILFLTTHMYFPQRVGGSESSTNDLCHLLRARGHSVAVISSLSRYDKVWVVNRFKAKIKDKLMPSDNLVGYPVFRGWDFKTGLKEVLQEFQPDCVVTQAGENIPIIKYLDQLSMKTFVYLRDVSFETHGGTYFQSDNVKYIANSKFTAKKFKSLFNIPSLPIPPSITVANYKVERKAKFVLFVCPYPQKGVDIALELAKNNPDIPFLFLESWQLTEKMRIALIDKLKKLPNVTFKHSQKSMLPIYAETKIALVPSQCEEAWGRIATESQINGIPVLASDIGGLPESVGYGGMLVPPQADVKVWSEKLRLLWDNDDIYDRYSALAKKHSQRGEISPTRLISVLEEYLYT
jgi:glycosyltransferase involved in cell wall biosynthesis